MSLNLKLKQKTSRMSAFSEKKQNFNDTIISWRGPEFENYPKDKRWYLTAFLILLAVIVYALYTNSPIMAITFILIGVVGYIYVNKDPRLLEFKITRRGVSAGNDIYEYENIQSFWIFYEPPHIEILSLRMKKSIIPYVHIPLHQKDPVKIRKELMNFIPEEKQNPSIIDSLERLLRI